MQRKVIWMDTETGGTNPNRHALLQLAGLIEIDGKIVDEFNYKIAPCKGAIVLPDSIEIHGLTLKQIATFPSPDLIFGRFLTLLKKHISPYDKKDKAYVGGFNVGFDCDFVGAWFRILGDKYGFGSYTNWRKLDPLPHMHALDYLGILSLPNYKLGTICEHYKIPLQAHDALSDIKATRRLWKLAEKWFADQNPTAFLTEPVKEEATDGNDPA